MAQDTKEKIIQNSNFQIPHPEEPAPEPFKPMDPPDSLNTGTIKTGIQKFPAMPVEQNDPGLPRLKSQSPPPIAQKQQAPPPPSLPKLKILGLFFNKMILFIIIVILFFITSSGLILAYTNYVVATPPKNIQNLIDKIITIAPIPNDNRPQRLKENF